MVNIGAWLVLLFSIATILPIAAVAQPLEQKVQRLELEVRDERRGLAPRLGAVEGTLNVNGTDRSSGVVPQLRRVESAIWQESTGLSPRLGKVEYTLGHENTGLVPRLGKVESTLTDPRTGLVPNLGRLDGQLNAKTVGLAARLQALEERVDSPQTGLTDTLKRVWMLLAAVLVFFMQAGFKCLEVGLGRRTHEGTIGIMNLMNWLILCMVFYCVGFGLMFGASADGLIGTSLFFPTAAEVQSAFKSKGLGVEFLLFQLAFAATAATIVDGAIAERTALQPYMLATALTALLVYPIVGHWVWNDDGWLKLKWLGPMYTDPAGQEQYGFHDFAGSTVVHSVGGCIAFAAAWVVGPRHYYSPDKAIQTVPYSFGYAVLGVMMLWFGWWGFNGGSLLRYDSTIASIVLNTNLAGASAGLCAYTHAVLTGNRNVNLKTIGGTLGGLVAITASCDVANSPSAMLIGAAAGIFHNWVFEGIPRWTAGRIDDVAAAIPVHLACGFLGTFSSGLVIWRLHGGRPLQIFVQIVGFGIVTAFTVGMSLLIFSSIDKWIGMRTSIAEEDGDRKRSAILGPYAGSLRFSFRRHPRAFWSRFFTFEELKRSRRTTEAVTALQEDRLQAIRDDGLEASRAEMGKVLGVPDAPGRA